MAVVLTFNWSSETDGGSLCPPGVCDDSNSKTSTNTSAATSLSSHRFKVITKLKCKILPYDYYAIELVVITKVVPSVKHSKYLALPLRQIPICSGKITVQQQPSLCMVDAHMTVQLITTPDSNIYSPYSSSSHHQHHHHCNLVYEHQYTVLKEQT